jgi:type I restriction enzyme S subunit
VIEDLKPYSETKDSGLAWLGDIPAHWEIKRNGSLFQQRIATGEPDWPILEVSLRTGVRIREFGSSKRKQVMSDKAKYKCATKGDFVYNMMRMWQGAAGIAPVDGLVSPAYVVAKPLPHTNPAYFASLFRTDDYLAEIDAFSRGIVKDRNRLYWDQFKQIPTPCPPPEEQAAIARFLAWATNRLDRAIGAKRRIITLLQEQKQAIIHHAVTRGLDPSVPLKDSGIPWLGEIPEHWEAKKIRSLAEVYGGMTPSKSAERYWTGDTPWISPKDMKKIEVTGSIAHISDAAVRETGIAVIPFPAVLFVVRGMILARRLPVAVTRIPVTLNQDMKGLMPRVDISAEYLAFLLSGAQKEILGLVEEAGHGTKCLRTDSWASFEVPLPARQEQNAICNFILSANSAIDNAALRLDSEITLLREYRTRLIADVVTGKLEVREVAKGLPEEELQDQPDVAAGYDADEAEDDDESDLIDTAED